MLLEKVEWGTNPYSLFRNELRLKDTGSSTTSILTAKEVITKTIVGGGVAEHESAHKGVPSALHST